MIIVTSCLFIPSMSREARRIHGLSVYNEPIVHWSQSTRGQLSWLRLGSLMLLTVRTAWRCPFERQMTKICMNLLNLRCTRLVLKESRLPGMLCPELSLPFTPGIPSLVKKDWNSSWCVDDHSTAVPQLRPEWHLIGIKYLGFWVPFSPAAQAWSCTRGMMSGNILKHLQWTEKLI